MSGLLTDINPYSLLSIITISFMIGAISSVHCVGMCGPIMLINSQRIRDKVYYQLGRLFSYLVLLITIYYFKNEVIYYVSQSFYFKLVFYFIGGVFVLYGLSLFTPLNIEFKSLGKLYSKLFSKLPKHSQLNSLILGSISILLPCSTLYLFIIGVLGLLKFEFAFAALLAFWLPTSLALVFGTEVLNVLQLKKAPKVYGTFFIFIGLLTIALRLYNWTGLETFCY